MYRIRTEVFLEFKMTKIVRAYLVTNFFLFRVRNQSDTISPILHCLIGKLDCDVIRYDTIQYNIIMSTSSDDSDDEYECHRLLMLQCAMLVTCTAGAALSYGFPLYDKMPYYTSALTGADWVCELLNGHPERIRNELGVHKHIFKGLVIALEQAGIHSSKHVYLKEQLSIFLYTSVTGLSLHHVSEQFQHAIDTTSQFI